MAISYITTTVAAKVNTTEFSNKIKISLFINQECVYDSGKTHIYKKAFKDRSELLDNLCWERDDVKYLIKETKELLETINRTTNTDKFTIVPGKEFAELININTDMLEDLRNCLEKYDLSLDCSIVFAKDTNKKLREAIKEFIEETLDYKFNNYGVVKIDMGKIREALLNYELSKNEIKAPKKLQSSKKKI